MNKKNEQAKIFIGIPTGPPKTYSLLHIFASLADLEWTNKEVHWAVTTYDLPDDTVEKKESDQFNLNINHLNKASCLPFPSTIHIVKLNLAQIQQNYRIIVENRNFLRQKFLESNCDYFLAVDGDVAPPRETVKRLIRHNVDLAFAVCYQRPGIDGTHPLVWVPMWTLDQLPPNLPEPLTKDFRVAFKDAGICLPLWYMPNWRRKKILSKFTCGLGCGLIKRHVLEQVKFHVPTEFQHHSEDLHFFMECMAAGFKMKCDLKFVAPHLHKGGFARQDSNILVELAKNINDYPKLPSYPPPPLQCRICGKPKQRIRVNDYVVFSAHLDPDQYYKCRSLAIQEFGVPATLAFATTFTKPLNQTLEKMLSVRVNDSTNPRPS